MVIAFEPLSASYVETLLYFKVTEHCMVAPMRDIRPDEL